MFSSWSRPIPECQDGLHRHSWKSANQTAVEKKLTSALKEEQCVLEVDENVIALAKKASSYPPGQSGPWSALCQIWRHNFASAPSPGWRCLLREEWTTEGSQLVSTPQRTAWAAWQGKPFPDRTEIHPWHMLPTWGTMFEKVTSEKQYLLKTTIMFVQVLKNVAGLDTYWYQPQRTHLFWDGLVAIRRGKDPQKPILICADNTFATAWNQQPLKLGVDVVTC